MNDLTTRLDTDDQWLHQELTRLAASTHTSDNALGRIVARADRETKEAATPRLLRPIVLTTFGIAVLSIVGLLLGNTGATSDDVSPAGLFPVLDLEAAFEPICGGGETTVVDLDDVERLRTPAPLGFEIVDEYARQFSSTAPPTCREGQVVLSNLAPGRGQADQVLVVILRDGPGLEAAADQCALLNEQVATECFELADSTPAVGSTNNADDATVLSWTDRSDIRVTVVAHGLTKQEAVDVANGLTVTNNGNLTIPSTEVTNQLTEVLRTPFAHHEVSETTSWHATLRGANVDLSLSVTDPSPEHPLETYSGPYRLVPVGSAVAIAATNVHGIDSIMWWEANSKRLSLSGSLPIDELSDLARAINEPSLPR